MLAVSKIKAQVVLIVGAYLKLLVNRVKSAALLRTISKSKQLNSIPKYSDCNIIDQRKKL